MAKITKQQIQKINNMCSNGWHFDLEYYIHHTEKQLIKCIELDEESYLKFTICYNSQNQMLLYISKYYHKKGDYFAHSEELAKRTMLNGTPTKKKELNKLIPLTHLLSDKELMEINKNIPVSDGRGILHYPLSEKF